MILEMRTVFSELILAIPIHPSILPASTGNIFPVLQRVHVSANGVYPVFRGGSEMARSCVCTSALLVWAK